MNKAMKKNLEAVVNSIVNEDSEAATSAFHDYLRAKTQSILLGEASEYEEESDEDETDEDEDDDDDKKEKKDKKDDKDDKKPAFLKKGKKDKEEDDE